MSEILSHRGPDDYGYLYASGSTGRTHVTQEQHTDFMPNVLLANRRLSITDLSVAGRQPFPNETNDIFVVFNGAIHNYVELRQELRQRGYRFHSQTDTEVVLHAYEEWGETCATRFNGMWAYAIWDQRHRCLICSRDRFGIKPLFIARTSNAFYFASEAKAILANGDISREPNLQYIKHMLSADTPLEGRRTAFAGIEQLPAGHSLIVGEKTFVERRYWSYKDRSEAYDFTAPTDTFNNLFYDAVKIRLRGDVGSALLLSGGLDSSSIAAVAAALAPGKLEAFNARFSGFHDDESEFASLAAHHASLPITLVDYEAKHLVEDLARVTWHMDAPVAKGQTLARWSLIQSASAGGAKILLEGQGADELLGGYPDRYARAYLHSEFSQPRLSAMHVLFMQGLAGAAGYAKRRLRREMSRTWSGGEHAGSSSLLSRRVSALPPYDSAVAQPEGVTFDDPLSHRLWQDHTSLLLPYLLHFGDAISMGNSMESRLPFLDHRLVEFVFALPFYEKIRNGEFKVILRRALAHRLSPQTLARRRKVGFATPVDKWLRPVWDSEIIPLLGSSRLQQRDLFDKKELGRLLAAFDTRGHQPLLILRCAAVELWFRQFIDGDGRGY